MACGRCRPLPCSYAQPPPPRRPLHASPLVPAQRAAVAQSMSSRLKDLHDKNYRLALEQQFIVVQPAWPAGAAAAGAVGEEQQGEQPATAAARQEEQAQQEQQQKEQQQQEGAHSHEQQADTPQAAAACGGGSSSGDAGAGSSEAGNGALVPVPPSGAARAAGGGGGPVLQVERDAALMSPYIQKEVVQNGVGLPGNPPVLLPKQVRRRLAGRAPGGQEGRRPAWRAPELC